MRPLRCDFLCVGGGLGGLAGAARAHDLGLDTMIVERSGMVGGIASYGAGLVWAPASQPAREAGIEDSPEEALRYLDSYSNDAGVPLRRAFVESIAPAVDWFATNADVPFELLDFPDEDMATAGARAIGRQLQVKIEGRTLREWQHRTRIGPHFPAGVTMDELRALASAPDRLEQLSRVRRREDLRTLGPGLVAGFARAALVDRQISIRLDTRVVELQQRDGAVVGAVAISGRERTPIDVRHGVLLATGSYGNAPYAASLEGVPEIHDCGPPLADGDNLALTDPTPAAMVRGGTMFATAGLHFPGELHAGTRMPLCRQFTSSSWAHSIVANSRGERFGDETFHGPDIRVRAAVDPLTQRWRNFPCFLIADDRLRQDHAFGPLKAGADWPDDFPHADELRTLAATIGVDPEGLERTVDRYNGFVAQGVDRDFGRGGGHIGRSFAAAEKGNPNLTAIAEPPFWGIRLTLTGGGLYSFGVAIDCDGCALTRTGEPVRGLYLTGNAAARVDVPRYHAGMADARNITYAFNAATHASRG
jgi:3-oxosteroid 1-dehydrogenase